MCACLGEIHCSSVLLTRNEELIHAQALWGFMLVEIYKGTFDNLLENFRMKCVCGGVGGDNRGADFSLCFPFTALLTLQICTESCSFHFSVLNEG